MQKSSSYSRIKDISLKKKWSHRYHASSNESPGIYVFSGTCPSFWVWSAKTAGGDRCLQAITIALDAASDGKRWYTSTANLQLASLSLCIACRHVATLHVRMDMLTPPRLWDPAAAQSIITDDPRGGSEQRTVFSRVPPIRARSLRWERPVKLLEYTGMAGSSDEKKEEGGLPAKSTPNHDIPRSPVTTFDRVRYLVFGRDFKEPVDSVVWPHTLQKLRFGYSFNQPIDGVSWPTSLRQLIFGERFNHPIDNVKWPASLVSLTFGFHFDQRIDAVTWPTSLQHVTFVYGSVFNQPLNRVRWPPSLKAVTFGHAFNQPVDRVLWPASLQQLTFGAMFNQSMDGVEWPASLQRLTYGQSFDQPLVRGQRDPLQQRRYASGTGHHERRNGFDGVSKIRVWPDSLQQLKFGYEFSQPINSIRWPESLRELTFGCRFNQEIQDVIWPASLERLTFIGCFNQPIESVQWPTSLQHLSFGNYFDQRLTTAEWPAGLQELRLRNPRYSHSLRYVRWPIGLKRLVVRSKLKKIDSIKLPCGAQIVICDG